MISKQPLIYAILLLIIDLTWLKTIMIPLYQQLAKSLQFKMTGNIVAAVIAYSLLILTYPLLIAKSRDKIRTAAISGFLIYGTYAFTLSAFLPNYNLYLALTETIWGTVLLSGTTYLTLKLS